MSFSVKLLIGVQEKFCVSEQEGECGVRSQKNRWLCVWIAFFVLIAGMYFDGFKIDSVFVCAPMPSASRIAAMEFDLTDAKACTTEMLGIRGTLESKHAAGCVVHPRRDNRSIFLFFCPNITAQKQGKFYTGVWETQLCAVSQKTLVTNYIHKSDGKKRI